MARATVASLHSFLKCAVIHSRLSTNARRYHINIVVTLRILIKFHVTNVGSTLPRL
jgi:hypothetical protein